MKDIEIEVQVRVDTAEHLKKFLEMHGSFRGEVRQIDEYFTPAHKDFTKTKPIEEWFRLRDENGSYSINYKRWHYDEHGIGQYADEFESPVANRESVKKIIRALEMRSLITVDKTRRKYDFEEYEVALDTVKGLGDFVEVEYKGSRAVEPKAMTEQMIAFLKKNSCGKIALNNGGYPMLLLFPEEAHFITA